MSVHINSTLIMQDGSIMNLIGLIIVTLQELCQQSLYPKRKLLRGSCVYSLLLQCSDLELLHCFIQNSSTPSRQYHRYCKMTSIWRSVSRSYRIGKSIFSGISRMTDGSKYWVYHHWSINVCALTWSWSITYSMGGWTTPIKSTSSNRPTQILVLITSNFVISCPFEKYHL